MIQTHPFGSTGHDSTFTLFGAAAFNDNCSQAEADRTLEVLLEYGVNHIDTAPRYGDSELRVGAWMPEHRGRFFLATKTSERGYAASRDQIQRSLERLRVDSVDMLQLHSMAHPGDWDTVFGDEGALEAVVEAREEGLTRFIGITGHGWTIANMHLRSLERFAFDAVLMPWNYLMAENERYRNDFMRVVAVCRERGIAVQTIKSIARGPWGTAPKSHNPWYQPLESQEDIDRAVHWVMAHEGLFLNTVGDRALLPRVLNAASRYTARPDDVVMQTMLETQRVTSPFGLAT